MKKQWIIFGLLAIVLIGVICVAIALGNAEPGGNDETTGGGHLILDDTTGSTDGTTTDTAGEATTGDETVGDATTGNETVGDETTGDTTTGTKPSTGSKPATDTTKPSTDTTKPSTDATVPSEGNDSETTTPSQSEQGDSGEITFQDYKNMTGNEQKEYYNSFASVEDFLNWYNAAKEAYEKEQKDNSIVIGNGGSIDIGDYINP